MIFNIIPFIRHNNVRCCSINKNLCCTVVKAFIIDLKTFYIDTPCP